MVPSLGRQGRVRERRVGVGARDPRLGMLDHDNHPSSSPNRRRRIGGAPALAGKGMSGREVLEWGIDARDPRLGMLDPDNPSLSSLGRQWKAGGAQPWPTKECQEETRWSGVLMQEAPGLECSTTTTLRPVLIDNAETVVPKPSPARARQGETRLNGLLMHKTPGLEC